MCAHALCVCVFIVLLCIGWRGGGIWSIINDSQSLKILLYSEMDMMGRLYGFLFGTRNSVFYKASSLWESN